MNVKRKSEGEHVKRAYHQVSLQSQVCYSLLFREKLLIIRINQRHRLPSIMYSDRFFPNTNHCFHTEMTIGTVERITSL